MKAKQERSQADGLKRQREADKNTKAGINTDFMAQKETLQYELEVIKEEKKKQERREHVVIAKHAKMEQVRKNNQASQDTHRLNSFEVEKQYKDIK